MCFLRFHICTLTVHLYILRLHICSLTFHICTLTVHLYTLRLHICSLRFHIYARLLANPHSPKEADVPPPQKKKKKKKKMKRTAEDKDADEKKKRKRTTGKDADDGPLHAADVDVPPPPSSEDQRKRTTGDKDVNDIPVDAAAVVVPLDAPAVSHGDEEQAEEDTEAPPLIELPAPPSPTAGAYGGWAEYDHEGDDDGVGGAVVSTVPEAQEATDFAPLGNW
ncbi:hypothetical protein FJT64_026027 [Amphibalanus amphitrite]|uniref:Uncharacterized protein n=1 Tax=Amphibalanus amphitrite TaxID=1232801 RepID=A0A6A4W6W1_AMPAM|nr:hypothetical protein FJT64_026027 [Amphibalanus amphitrite]